MGNYIVITEINKSIQDQEVNRIFSDYLKTVVNEHGRISLAQMREYYVELIIKKSKIDYLDQDQLRELKQAVVDFFDLSILPIMRKTCLSSKSIFVIEGQLLKRRMQSLS